VNDTPLLPTPLYGLRTWTVVGERGAELLAGPQQRTTWPAGGAWLDAACARSPEHQPPAQDCGCGLHAWHPARRSARRVLASRREVAGIAEARGIIELHEDGFRAEQARPRALVLVPGRNAPLVRRLADAYDAEVLEVDGADALLAACRARGLGLDEATVASLLGPLAEESRRARRRAARANLVRLAAALAVGALLVVGFLQVATDPPCDRVLKGRTGEIHIESR
jgi:hypothetical protein